MRRATRRPERHVSQVLLARVECVVTSLLLCSELRNTFLDFWLSINTRMGINMSKMVDGTKDKTASSNSGVKSNCPGSAGPKLSIELIVKETFEAIEAIGSRLSRNSKEEMVKHGKCVFLWYSFLISDASNVDSLKYLSTIDMVGIEMQTGGELLKRTPYPGLKIDA